MILDIGLDKKDRKLIVDTMVGVLADTVILALKARNFHWNVVGANFKPLHDLFQEIYEDLDQAADIQAERIRALGFHCPGSYGEFIAVSSIKEEQGTLEAMDMIRRIILDIELLIRRSDEVKVVAMSVNDDATADVMIERLQSLGKFAWMLRSHLE
ncbi:Dps family protein [Candidatus Odyssella thessalonicensis]|uniref:Dps family protein n=1 Tax=Candidatus Odyssella thessalonicensis TaxID=84647 RepID=UPI000225B936|nr:Dps family protein [Candidatus Odyssella thessalonicensis]